MLSAFLQFVSQHQLVHKGQPVLLAVSGGVDSVVMVKLFHDAGFTFAIAHANFQLRGEESMRDEHFVRELAASYGVPIYVKQFNTRAYMAAHGYSVQVAARELRYAWLEELRYTQGYELIATAHHLNDQAETMLINFCRGTGIAGLHGIRIKHQHVIRPLLFATRAEIESFAQQQGLQYVTDSSNLADDYLRNAIRHRVMPELLQLFPALIHTLASSAKRLEEVEMLYQQAVERHRKRLIVQKGEEYWIPVQALLLSKPLHSLIFELFKPFGFGEPQIPDIVQLLKSSPGKQLLSPTHRVIRDRKWLIITPQKAEQVSMLLIESPDIHTVQVPGLTLRIHLQPIEKTVISSDALIAYLDADQVPFPWVLRKWKQGDYFYPLGMKKKKKLSRFFIDQKLSLLDKERIWVIETADHKIAWVIGLRIDERCKITDHTQRVLRLEARME
ncbi:MAG: tRNA lysidine(34) synthetase TilS [Thermoflavifilum sp.]|nr:tRNA lysidine(34) synthetase TilS [Thermoflavifilum sp.]